MHATMTGVKPPKMAYAILYEKEIPENLISGGNIAIIRRGRRGYWRETQQPAPLRYIRSRKTGVIKITATMAAESTFCGEALVSGGFRDRLRESSWI
jgi:hypothetical protein